MGKRKRATKKPSTTKKSQKLDTVFTCPMCSHEKVVDCTIDRESGIGKCECRVCSATYQCSISKLEIAIDVYSYWIDALEEINSPTEAKPITTAIPTNSALPAARNHLPDDLDHNHTSSPNRRTARKTLHNSAARILDEDDDDDDDY